MLLYAMTESTSNALLTYLRLACRYLFLTELTKSVSHLSLVTVVCDKKWINLSLVFYCHPKVILYLIVLCYGHFVSHIA